MLAKTVLLLIAVGVVSFRVSAAPTTQFTLRNKSCVCSLLVSRANAMALGGIGCLMLAMTGILSLLSGHLFGWLTGAIVAVGAAALLGGLWFGVGLARRRHLKRR